MIKIILIQEYENENEKNKYKNISSYIIKKDSTQEEQIERENDKRQIELYNEYLLVKKEREENKGKSNLPHLLPLLIPHDSNDEDDDDEEEEENEDSYKRRPYVPPPRRRIRMVSSFGKRFIGGRRKRGYLPRFRGRRIRRNFY